MDTPTPSQPAGGQPAGQQNGLLALFLEDQRLLGGGGSAFGQPDGAASTSCDVLRRAPKRLFGAKFGTIGDEGGSAVIVIDCN